MQAIAELILHHRERIVDRWVEMARGLPTAERLTRRELVDSLPELLEEIAGALGSARGDGGGAEDRERSLEAAFRHGRTRQEQRFDFLELIDEYRLLRRSILDVVGPSLTRGDLGGIRELHALLDRVIERAAGAYARDRFQEEESLDAALDAQRRTIETVLRQLPVGVIVSDATGKLIHGNSETERIWRHPFIPSGSIDRYHEWRGFHADGRPYEPEEWPLARAVLRGDQVRDEEIRIVRGDGAYGWIRVSAEPVKDAAGDLLAGVVVVLDITPEKEREEERSGLLEHLREAVVAREHFIAVAAHELRSPLSALSFDVQAAVLQARRRQLPEERVVERLESILHRVERLSSLVETLLDVSRVSAGKLRLRIEEVDLCEVVRHVRERMAAELATAECRVELHLPERVTGAWDRQRLEQVVENLLGNAMKFGRGKPIDVRVEEARSTVRLGVTDRGVGIAPEDQKAIFERFERAGTATGFSGFGLGLWITRQILEAFGGSIEVESEIGRGATFTAVLPQEVKR